MEDYKKKNIQAKKDQQAELIDSINAAIDRQQSILRTDTKIIPIQHIDVDNIHKYEYQPIVRAVAEENQVIYINHLI
jgi:hypothetical protein